MNDLPTGGADLQSAAKTPSPYWNPPWKLFGSRWWGRTTVSWVRAKRPAIRRIWNENWSRQRESNPQPSRWQRDALPLSHVCIGGDGGSRTHNHPGKSRMLWSIELRPQKSERLEQVWCPSSPSVAQAMQSVRGGTDPSRRIPTSSSPASAGWHESGATSTLPFTCQRTAASPASCLTTWSPGSESNRPPPAYETGALPG